MRDENEPRTPSGTFGRRKFLRLSAAAAAAPAIGRARGKRDAWSERFNRHEAAGKRSLISVRRSGCPRRGRGHDRRLRHAMHAGDVTALQLVNAYRARIAWIDQDGPRLNSVMQVNPDAVKIAKQLDDERAHGHVRGPLHGIPMMLKGNIDTADKMQTTAGSLALVGHPALQDSTVADRLRQAGAIILGKTNLSEFANFRSFHSSSGWSGVGGQTHNPYVLDRNPSGSSSGSAASVSASLCAAGLGTETDGSIVSPANNCGVVGIKPTVGLTSRAGVVPIAHSQDTVGPHGRTVADAAALLGALVGVDQRDPGTSASAGKFHHDYTQYLDKHGLQGARIGVARAGFTGYSEETDAVFEAAIQAMAHAGATIVDPADIATIDEISTCADEVTVLVYEFKRDLNAYLASRSGIPVHNLSELIAFNEAHAVRELHWFGQEWLTLTHSDPFTHAQYATALAHERQLGGHDGIDATLKAHNLDALVAPTGSPAWGTDLVNGDLFLGASSGPAAIAGYPIVQVPAGNAFGLPLGISFMGTAWSEPKLIKLASGFEHATRARIQPHFHPTLPTGLYATSSVRRGVSRPGRNPAIARL